MSKTKTAQTRSVAQTKQPEPPRYDVTEAERPTGARDVADDERAERDREVGRFTSYIQELQSGSVSAALRVINAAHDSKLADQAVRLHIAELIDQGRESELTTQLRAYAVKYLVYPSNILRKRDA